MVRNTEKYEQAVQLRKRGFTLEEIAKYCDVSKSTVSNWLKNKAFSASVTEQNKRRVGRDNAKRLKLMAKARGAERAARYREAARSAETEYKHYKSHPLFVAGLMLYFTEGDQKNERVIRFSTTNQNSHKLFIKFGMEYLGLTKQDIHFWLLLYPTHDETSCMKKWQRVTSLPYAQFYKNQFVTGQSPKETLHFGVGNTIIGSTVLKVKLNRWIELAVKDLSK